MPSPFRSAAFATAFFAAASAGAAEIRVCADPDNLPFSNDAGAGFENRIMEIVAKAIGASLTYVWWDDRLAPMTETLNKRDCDVVSATLAGLPDVATTRAYLTSAYAIVTRSDEPKVASLDDPALRTMTIGIQTIGDDGVVPPAAALVRRGFGDGIRPYTFHGHYSDPNSSAAIVADVASGTIDAAILWGPFAGYFAAAQAVPLTVTLVRPAPTDLPMVFDIAMATRANDTSLRDAIDKALAEHHAEIDAVLDGLHVPHLARAAQTGSAQ
jgi:mxaJ protein